MLHLLAYVFFVLQTVANANSLGSNEVKLTPWCDNSMRVRITPSSMPPATQPAVAALAKTLAAKNMTDLAGALVDTCNPGEPLVAQHGAPPTTHGNLVATIGADDSIQFTRKDTGALLFSAKASFALNEYSAAKWTTIPDKITSGCSGSEYAGSLGSKDSAADCLAAVEQSASRINYAVWRGDSNKGCFTCDLSDRGDPSTWIYKDMKGASSFVGPPLPKLGAGYLQANLTITTGDKDEVVYGLGQGNWTDEGGCPAPGLAGSRIVPLERNGQSVNLQQRKFHVSIPFAYSTAGYGFLFNMPGYGAVTIGAHGVGGAAWSQTASLYLDFWVSALPAGVAASSAGPIYKQYADATGHAPPLREKAMAFWQSRNRYKSSDIALSIAQHYQQLKLDVGVLVIDYKNQLHDGDFAPNPACYPSVKTLSDGVRKAINATTMFSFWCVCSTSVCTCGCMSGMSGMSGMSSMSGMSV
jgi:alpha-D-xyloside xylohydrolase